MRKMALMTLVLGAAVLLVIGIGAQQRQPRAKVEEAYEASRKVIDEQLPIVDYDEPKPTDARERARRLAKDQRHNFGTDRIEEGITEMQRIYDWPSGFPALPVKESTTVLIGEVMEAKAHISENRSAVYSEVVIKIDELLKGKEQAYTIVAEREGGRVRFPSGAIFRYFRPGMGMAQVGHHYLFFLKQIDDGDYSILTGYELINGRAIPLDQTGAVPFEKYKGTEETKFVSAVRELIRSNKTLY